MGQIRNENVKESPMTRFGSSGTPDNRSRRLRNPSFTAAEWTANNPLLQLGEIGYETDTHKTKIGDGVTSWTDLPYQFDDAGASTNLDNLTTTGKANVSAQGTYDADATYGAGTVGNAIGKKADKATTLAGYGITDGANTDLSNLTATGKNIGLWCDNAANIIAEIPQDINLTLSAGTLTLKAGSKVYKPNGFEADGTTPKFDVVTVDADKSVNMFGVTGQTMVFVRNDVTVWGNVKVDNCLSGTTVPENHTGMFYNTDENKIYYYSGGVKQDTTFSLPLSITTASSGTVTSIDQVFNGFGFIGNTVFALPGVKVAAPDGRNADGTLKNNFYTIDTVKIGNTYAGTWFYHANSKYISVAYYTRYFEQETMPSVNCSWYQPSTNIMYHVDNGVATVAHEVKIFNATRESGVYTSLTPYMPFRAVDYSDTEFIAHQSKPSGRYIDLSWATSGSSYTMPADGYLTGRRNSDAAGQYLFVYKDNTLHGLYSFWSVGGSQGACFCVPVSKGDTIMISYSIPNAQQLQFYYANGAK